jgi:Uma2 family endonuclease
MKEQTDHEVVYYYDLHPTEEDLMGETSLHAALIHYLVEVLRWLFRGHICAIHENLNFYQTRNYKEYPVAPDIAVIKGRPFEVIPSLRVGGTNPSPQVIFEILSEETWREDLEEKPGKYAQMGVQEYFAYDPNPKPLARAISHRLFGWRRAEQTGLLSPLRRRRDGRLWSTELDSWLVPDGSYLRLYDRDGQIRLTGEEAEARRADAEARRANVLAEKLRSLGIDPNQL